MTTPTMTRDIAWSIAQDTANTQMCNADRGSWSRDDYTLAVATFDRLWPQELDYQRTHTTGWVSFAGDLEYAQPESTASASEAFSGKHEAGS